MNKNHIVKFLVDKEQLEKLKMNASLSGFITLSAYLRYIAIKGVM